MARAILGIWLSKNFLSYHNFPGFAHFITWIWNNPKKLEKAWITKGLETWQSLGLILSMVTVGAYGGPGFHYWSFDFLHGPYDFFGESILVMWNWSKDPNDSHVVGSLAFGKKKRSLEPNT